jgi:hypothetical protein
MTALIFPSPFLMGVSMAKRLLSIRYKRVYQQYPNLTLQVSATVLDPDRPDPM